MSLETIRSECSDWAALLQPFVDGELVDEEQERVAEHLTGCHPCRSAVSEQGWVRNMLRSLDRERAPQALHARILQGLDEVDGERSEAPPGQRSWWSRLRDLGRGGMIMVPAGAVAMGLFFLARQGAFPGHEPQEAGAVAAAELTKEADRDDDLLDALTRLEPQVGFSVQVAPTRPTGGVELVGARLAGASGPSGARLEYRMVDRGGHPTGHRLVDVQTNKPVSAAPNTRQVFRGREYHLTRDGTGRAHVHFSTGGVTHVVSIRGDAPLPPPTAEDLLGRELDFATLLVIADELAQNSENPR